MPSHVAGFTNPSIQGGPHFGEGFNVFRVGGVDQVFQLIGVSLGIKKVLTPEVCEEGHKVWVEFSFFIKIAHHLLNGEALLLIKIYVGTKVKLGLVIANIVVALAPN